MRIFSIPLIQFYALICLIFFSAGFPSLAQTDPELKVLTGNSSNNSWLNYSNASVSLYHHLLNQSLKLLEERKERMGEISSRTDWQRRQKEVRQVLDDIMGPFPERTPLNARVTKTIDKADFSVEHVVFESQPGFHVTGSVFMPKGINGKLPVVIICSGHQADTYRGEASQSRILNFVKKGFLVFAFDPVGQGERLEYYDPEKGSSTIGSSTREHSYPGAQAFITGSSQANYMTWDGIRSVDYLLTRSDVDPSRIGITGGSGGGTQSAYIAAYDDRIYAAAPGNYITNFTRLLQSIGPQDAEQNLPRGLKMGIDHADLLSVRAPKPALIYATTRDFFSIEGTWETYREVKAQYSALGTPDNFDITVDHAGHSSTEKNRKAVYAFFQMHLNNPGSPEEVEVEVLTQDEIQVSPTGQVSTSFEGETVFSLNLKEAEKRLAALKASRENPEPHLAAVLDAARQLSGYVQPGDTDSPVFTGGFQKEGYVLEKYFVKGEGDYVLPYLLFVPETANGKAMIYLHPQDKATEAGEEGEIHWFVENGFTVLAPDLPGTGELTPEDLRAPDPGKEWHASILIGRSLVGIRAAEINRLVGMLKQKAKTAQVYGLARGEMGAALLHAAAFNEDINRVALVESYPSYRTLVTQRFYRPGFILHGVLDALKSYDLPDLASALAPRPLMMTGITDGKGDLMNAAELEEDISFIRSGYGRKKADEALLVSQPSSANLEELFRVWIKD